MAASERPDEYVTIYRFMTRELGLGGAELLVYARVLSFCTEPDGSYYESRSRCADFFGLSSRQVARAFRRLCDAGLIDDMGVRHHQKGCDTREYRVNREAISVILHGGPRG
jgi:hypothetical protein